MKVFAEFIIENEISYRRTTILQFGNSWDLIGSAVLKNPGSAKPVDAITDENFENIARLYPCLDLETRAWYNFTSDPTMGFLSKIFNGRYINKEKQLNGIIQLFNLYYVIDANIVTAREKTNNNNSQHLHKDVSEIIPLFKEKPIFLGWFKEYNLSEETKLNSKKIFDFVSSGKNMYLDPVFGNNKFYHPIYINRSSKALSLQETLWNFYEVLENSN